MDLVMAALTFLGDFTHGRELEGSGMGGRGQKEGMGHPFGLPRMSVFCPQCGKGYPTNALLIFTQVWLRNNKMQGEKQLWSKNDLRLNTLPPTSCVTLLKSFNLSELIYEIRLMGSTLKVIEKTE